MTTLILPAPTGDLPDELLTLDVDALRKKTMHDLLDLADKFALRWPGDVNAMRFTHLGVERVSLYLNLDDDEMDAHAAWADALYLNPEPDSGHVYKDEPYITRSASAHGALAGFHSVHLNTHLYIGRGLPEQGPRPEPVDEIAADAAQVVAAVLTQEPSEIGRPDIVPGDEFADWDAAERDAVRAAYQAEYGPELVDEQRREDTDEVSA